MAEFADRLDAAIKRPVPPEVVRGSVQLCQEVRFPEDTGLERLPIPTHCAGDAGPYVTSGVVALRDGHRRNAGVYRMQVHGSRRLTILTNRFHDGHRILQAAAEAGRTVDVAISIGVDPAVFISAFWAVGPDVEEFAVAGALLGHPLLLAPALSVEIEVPAHAEVVIEGRIRPGNEEIEGPFADPEVVLRVSAHDPSRDVVERLTRELAPLVTSGPPGVTGYTGPRPKPHRVLSYWPTLVSRAHVRPQVTVRPAREWIA